MGVAYLSQARETRRLGWLTGPLFVYVGGYGPLLCAVTAAAYLKELRHAEAHWEKTAEDRQGGGVGVTVSQPDKAAMEVFDTGNPVRGPVREGPRGQGR